MKYEINSSPNEFLNYKQIHPGIDQYNLDINVLYPNQKEKNIFLERLKQFISSDEANSSIMELHENIFSYKSESIIPTKVDNRPPLLLVFGNPAPHSIKAGMFFSHEGEGREHRVWRVLREIGLLDFDINTNIDINTFRKASLFDLHYSSPFRIGLISYFSLPTSSSVTPWAGVAGIEKLFGKDGFKKVIIEERKRLDKVIQGFMPLGGNIIVFQKDSYNGLKDENAKGYSRDDLNEGRLVSLYNSNKDIIITAVPPTRLLHSQRSKDALRGIIKDYSF